MTFLQATEVTYRAGDWALAPVSLSLEKGKFACLLGPSGCGKTTLLRLIAGLEKPAAGRIELDGLALNDGDVYVTPDKRGIGMVFQEPSLFPAHTVEGNIRFGLPRKGRQTRTQTLLKHIGLEDKARAYSHELSGGQQHRVALARALAPSPKLLLLDEPFAHLDTELRERLRSETKALAEAEGVTCLMVTHDISEAEAVGDICFQMDDCGKLTEI